MAVTRVSACDYGGVEVWDSRDGWAVYLNPSMLAAYVDGGELTAAGQTWVDQIIASRLAVAEIEQNMREVLA